jgi:N-acetylglucosaminyl-diphospho-decaprenol L-rhamnosyltransferase
MNLTVGVITSNSERALPDLLRSLPAGLTGVDSWRLVIADSGSRDGTIEVARRITPEATIVQSRNLGFAAMVNAIAAVDPLADAVLILSQTARLTPGCAARLLAALQQPGVGVAVPRLLDGAGQPFPSLRRKPVLSRALGEALLGGRFTRRFPALTHVVANPGGCDERTVFDWATGGVTMVSRDCLAKTGPWDESFFLYSEELDFELRAADHGFAVRLAPDAVAIHLGGESQVRPELWAHLCANGVRVYGKRHRPALANLFWGAVVVGELLRLPVRAATRRVAIGKLVNERAALVAGRPAKKPKGYD